MRKINFILALFLILITAVSASAQVSNSIVRPSRVRGPGQIPATAVPAAAFTGGVTAGANVTVTPTATGVEIAASAAGAVIDDLTTATDKVWSSLKVASSLALYLPVIDPITDGPLSIDTTENGIYSKKAIGTLANGNGLTYGAVSCSWATADTFYAAMSGGSDRIYKTIDGGSNWAAESILGTTDLVAYSIASDGTGIAVAVGQGASDPFTTNKGIRTSDGGLTWADITLPSNWFWDTVATNRTGIWISTANNNKLARSTDNGATWVEVVGALGSPKTSFASDGGAVFIGVGANGADSSIVRSTDGGLTWADITPPDASWSGNEVVYCGGTKYAACGSSSSDSKNLIYSTDGGATWAASALADGLVYEALSSDRLGNVAAFNNDGTAYKSNDNGASWTALSVAGLDEYNWRSAAMNSESDLVVVSVSGTDKSARAAATNVGILLRSAAVYVDNLTAVAGSPVQVDPATGKVSYSTPVTQILQNYGILSWFTSEVEAWPVLDLSGYLTTSGKAADASLLNGVADAKTATASTIAKRDASGDLTARRFVSGLATGTSPLSVTSTTVNSNLNADLLDGNEASAFLGASATAANAVNLMGLSYLQYLPSKATIETLLGASAANLNGGIAVDTDKFTVADGTGDTVVGGTFNAKGAVTNDSTLLNTGNAKFSGEVAVTGDVVKYTAASAVANSGYRHEADNGGYTRVTDMSDTGYAPGVYSRSVGAGTGAEGFEFRACPSQDLASNSTYAFIAFNPAYTGPLTASDIFRIQNYTTTVARINASGNMTLGATDLASTTAKLYVDGVTKVKTLDSGTGDTAVYWDNATYTLATQASARRYKENIKPLDADWDKFMAIRPVSYTLIKDPKAGTKVGMIAEEVLPLYAGEVSTNPDGTCESVNYDRLVSPTIAAVQDLKRTVTFMGWLLALVFLTVVYLLFRNLANERELMRLNYCKQGTGDGE